MAQSYYENALTPCTCLLTWWWWWWWWWSSAAATLQFNVRQVASNGPTWTHQPHWPSLFWEQKTRNKTKQAHNTSGQLHREGGCVFSVFCTTEVLNFCLLRMIIGQCLNRKNECYGKLLHCILQRKLLNILDKRGWKSTLEGSDQQVQHGRSGQIWPCKGQDYHSGQSCMWTSGGPHKNWALSRYQFQNWQPTPVLLLVLLVLHLRRSNEVGNSSAGTL